MQTTARRFSFLKTGFGLCFAVVALSLTAGNPLWSANAPGETRGFTIVFSPEPVEWNPLRSYSALEAQLYTAVYEGLVSYNPVTLRPVPGAASKWDVSTDKKTYTFTIRDDAQFSDGLPLTAAHFQASWLKMLDPSVDSPFAGLLDLIKGARDYRIGKTKKASDVAIRVVDTKTLEVELSQPAPQFLQILCHQSLVPVHPDVLKKGTVGVDTKIVGNGPFKILSRSQDKIEFAPSETYWDKAKIHIGKLTILFSDDAEAISEAYNLGNVQWADSSADFSKLSETDHFQISPQFSTTMLYFSNDQKAFRDARVRRGLTLLLDLDELRSKEQNYVPSANLVPEIPNYKVPKGIEKSDRSEGLKLLADAGYPNGKGLPTIKIRLPEGSDYIVKILTDSWSDLDTKIDSTPMDPEAYYSALRPQDFTIASMSWVGDYADPMTFLDLWYGASSLNKSGYSNSDYDRLLDRSNNESGDKRYATLAEAEAKVLSDAQVIPISHSPSFNIIDLDAVDGWFKNPLNVHPFKYLQFKALRPPRNVAAL